jgi:glutamate-1-semialdehyde aminotransferase
MWNRLYGVASTNRLSDGFTASTFMNLGLRFCGGLDAHHTAEERRLYPILAKRMPAFQEDLELLSQHKEIHAGLTRLSSLLNGYKYGQNPLSLGEVKECMDGFGEVLWKHLDEEVVQLSPDKLSMYWSVDEVERDVNSLFTKYL